MCNNDCTVCTKEVSKCYVCGDVTNHSEHNDRPICEYCFDATQLAEQYMLDGMTRYAAQVKAGLIDPDY